MEQITLIPSEMIKLIPIFSGDKRHLGLFLRKCEYVIKKYRGDEAQNVYVMHTITSRLSGDAAALISEREDVVTWLELQLLLGQHFGDPRSEECIAIELESLRIKHGENYLDFCNRVQSVRSVIISKVNQLKDAQLKESKITIYNNMSLNVFLYNLPENLVRIVRLKAPKTLEEALSVVLEEVNFQEQYNMRNKLHSNSNTKQIPMSAFPMQSNKFINQIQPNSSVFRNSQPKFNFGIPQGQHFKVPQTSQQNFGFRSQPFGYKPQQFGYKPAQFGYRPQLPSAQPQAMVPQQFGYNPRFNTAVPNQSFGHRPPQHLNQFSKPLPNQTTDVSMRTLPPKPQPQQGFRLNEITHNDNEFELNNEYSYDVSCDPYDYSQENMYYNMIDNPEPENEQPTEELPQIAENFHILASTLPKKL